MKDRKDNVIYSKAFNYAVQIINVYKFLTTEKNEFVLSKQLLKSGTSIGANVREGIEAQSKKDFVSKLSIALKEACETEYWVELLAETKYLDSNTINTLHDGVQEIIKILNSIIKSTKQNI